MQRALVVSTTLRSAGHDPQSAILELQFCNGAVYQYFLVPPWVYQDLLGARSKGGYFNQNIRGRYPYQPIQHTPATRP
jgi:KTSC domain